MEAKGCNLFFATDERIFSRSGLTGKRREHKEMGVSQFLSVAKKMNFIAFGKRVWPAVIAQA
jgi:hypothetical protein